LTALSSKRENLGARAWRKFDLTVAPDIIRAWRDGELVGALDLSMIAESVKDAAERRSYRMSHDLLVPRIVPELHPRGPLGLFLEAGSASFRSVRITPLPVFQ
jgi:hypothetical protein